ncbi:MAG TPA: PDZ domain-containing protein [Thermoanaerobaculia bacterium]|nr:PDZ domain-containing protein [Thermoanaerobaculia bacterium]
MRRTTPLFIIAVTLFAAALRAQPVRYTLRFPTAQTNYVEVEASYPAAGAQQIAVMMPVWSPGSYLVREYSRNVENVSATTDRGETLPVEKVRKNRWRFPTRGASQVTFRYRVYGREMRVQTNYVDADFALINGAPTFIAPIDRLHGPFEVTVELPKSWSRSMSAMTVIEPNRYRAVDYDELVDSPIVAGNPAVHEFTVDGKRHYLVNIGDETFWDAERATHDVQKIVEQHRNVWGLLPYDRYMFFNFIVDAGGGLEHKSSTVLMTRRFQMRTRKGYIDWLDLVSHEQFHAWNVKRLRPVALGPFDYENENYTTNLWISEGFTDYYGALQVERAGLMTPTEYLQRLSRTIESLQTTPGRLTQPVAMASYDAWIKFYRPDENAVNTAISYYTKGAIVGWLLDAKVRKASSGARTLDDVMRTAYQRFSGPHGFTTDDFVGVVREIGGADSASWLSRVISTTEDLDYSDALSWFGLEFSRQKKSTDDDGEPKPEKAYLGLTAKADAGRLLVTQVKRGTPAFDAGINVDDEIIAIDDYRVPPEGLDTRLEQYKAGDAASIVVVRRGHLRTLPLKFATEPENVWKLHAIEKSTPDQTQHFNRWLHPQEKVAEMIH